jgi:NADP-dependent 3-hydroxy acid dehydrogenase YdfG
VDELTDEVAVVTGAASGIGFALCEAFAAAGMRKQGFQEVGLTGQLSNPPEALLALFQTLGNAAVAKPPRRGDQAGAARPRPATSTPT